MKFSEKLAELRRERGYSQEQLANVLNVTRQSVSKWEADSSMPELGKMIQLADLFGVSVDYLVREEIEEREIDGAGRAEHADTERIREQLDELTDYVKKRPSFPRYHSRGYEYQSRIRIAGLPLLHVCVGGGNSEHYKPAKGIFAVGDIAVGVVAVGGLGIGIVGIGGVGAGLLALGGLGIGVLAFGGGAIGLLAFGGAAVGLYACGGTAVGHLAIGDWACGNTVIGEVAAGDHILQVSEVQSVRQAAAFIREYHPRLPQIVVNVFASLAAFLKP